MSLHEVFDRLRDPYERKARVSASLDSLGRYGLATAPWHDFGDAALLATMALDYLILGDG